MTRTVGSGNDISIHSLRMEGDYRRCGDCNAYLGFQSTPSAWRETYVSSDAFAASHISIHSLRMEGDRPHPRWTQFRSHFNPLPPHGGRRILRSNTTDKKTHFNPLPPHGGRRRKTCYEVFADLRFQSTPSAWRETAFGYGFKIQLFHFNPLPPHGGRLLDQCHAVRIIFISIHSLRMEGDRKNSRKFMIPV